MKFSKCTTVIFNFFLIIALFACNATQQEKSPTDTLASSPSPLPQLTDTPEPTPTALPPLVVLLAPAVSEQGFVDELASTLNDLATQSGLRFETRQVLAPPDLEVDSIALVVVLPGVLDILDLVDNAAQTQFLVIGYNDLDARENLSLIKSGVDQPGALAFIAGYSAAVVTPDWRAGVIIEAGAPTGGDVRLAFVNGLYYFCGLCRSVYPPYPIPGYPLFFELSPGATQSDWDSGINYFEEWQVQTVYVSPPLDDVSFLNALSQAGFNLIANRQPPSGLEAHWVASISSGDMVKEVRTLLPQLLNGQGGQTIALVPEIEAANPDLFSPGRQKLVANMIADLAAGYIDTGVENNHADNP